MAKANFKMPDEFLKKGAEPVIEKAKSNLALRIGQGTKTDSISTGELLKSLETTKPVQDKDGNWKLRVGIPTTKDQKGICNALKAAVIEYGKSGQPPKPWLKQTKRASKKACIEAMKKALDKEIEKL